MIRSRCVRAIILAATLGVFAACVEDPAPAVVEVRARTHERGAADVVAFSHDGRWLAMPEGYGLRVRILDTETWVQAAEVEVESDVLALAFSPDDRHLYVACGGTGRSALARFDARTGKLDRRYDAPEGDRRSLAVSPDGRVLATAGPELEFRDTRTGALLRRGRSHCLEFTVAPAETGLLELRVSSGPYFVPWSEEEEGRPYPLPGEAAYRGYRGLRAIRSSADGGRLACVHVDTSSPSARTGFVRILEREGVGLREIADLPVESSEMLEHVALSPDGKLLATAGHGNVIRVWSVPAMALLGEKALSPPGSSDDRISITGLTFSPDSRYLVASREEPTPAIFRVAGLEEIVPWPGHADEMLDLRFLPGGRRLRTLGRDGTVCEWDAGTLRLLSRVSLPDGSGIAVLPVPESDPGGERNVYADGSRSVVVLSGSDKPPGTPQEIWCIARIIDTRTGRILHSIDLNMWGRVYVSPDGSRLAFAGNDGVLRLYTFRDR